jgi:imidazolonepropionase-like amidohydrolase
VQAASDWNTYVTAHVYTSNGVRRAIQPGVKGIEHGYTDAQKAKHDQALNGIDTMFTLAKKDRLRQDRLRFRHHHRSRLAAPDQ